MCIKKTKVAQSWIEEELGEGRTRKILGRKELVDPEEPIYLMLWSASNSSNPGDGPPSAQATIGGGGSRFFFCFFNYFS